jgi:multiple sugar transport system substrate-binding protein
VVEAADFATSQPYAQTFLDSMAIVKDFWAEPTYATLLQDTQKRHDMCRRQGHAEALTGWWRIDQTFKDDGKV